MEHRLEPRSALRRRVLDARRPPLLSKRCGGQVDYEIAVPLVELQDAATAAALATALTMAVTSAVESGEATIGGTV